MSTVSNSPPPRELRGNEAVYVAATEAGKTGIIFTALFTSIHYTGKTYFSSSYKTIPPHLKRIVAAVFTLGAVWFRANTAYASVVTEWHQNDAHIMSMNDEVERNRKQSALRIVQTARNNLSLSTSSSSSPPLK